MDAVKPHQPAVRAQPQITIARLHDGRHRILRQAVFHRPGACEIFGSRRRHGAGGKRFERESQGHKDPQTKARCPGPKRA
jgi:hypothetical protein